MVLGKKEQEGRKRINGLTDISGEVNGLSPSVVQMRQIQMKLLILEAGFTDIIKQMNKVILKIQLATISMPKFVVPKVSIVYQSLTTIL